MCIISMSTLIYKRDKMELLKQVLPENWQDVPVLRQFVDDLPQNPYCTNSKGFAYIRNKQNAIRHRYIQPNHPSVCKWLVFDIDDPEALFKCFDLGLLPPQVIIKNPNNGHAHLAYRLTTPVGIGGFSSVKAMRYLASVQQALADALGADKGYGGNLIKNPCYIKANAPRDQFPIWADQDEYEENGERDEHETYIVRGIPPSYTLAELVEYIDLNYEEDSKKQTDVVAVNDSGYGRNCTLFDELRHRAYKLEDRSYRSVESYLKPIADNINDRFDVPLSHNEVKHIIRSIARYCSKTKFTESPKRFSKLQRWRVQQRWGDNSEKKQQALKMHLDGVKKKDIAEQLGVTTKTLTRWGLKKKK